MEKDLSKIWRAVIEFKMLEDGDRILIGLSGGKDSMFLARALSEIKKHAPFAFDLACFTVNPMFSDVFPKREIGEFCRGLNLPCEIEDVNIPSAIKNEGPCYTCAYFRRAALNRKAKEMGFNKVALAHHNDDAVETFFMNLVTSGQLASFQPVTHLSRTGLTVIRPLIYYREYEIRSFVKKLGLTPLKNPCPHDGNTMRQKIKEKIAALEKEFPGFYEHLAAAMRGKAELWPEKPAPSEIRGKFYEFWQKK